MAFSQTAGLVGLPHNTMHLSLPHSLHFYGLSNGYFLPQPSPLMAVESSVPPHSISRGHTSVTFTAEMAQVWQLVRGWLSLGGAIIS